ncbi:hypothetical protein [Paenibacillus sp. HB172176]|uniref:hypothetical protein n=1 Tax=Paenibacillus sp. HB172176 TaxID=2493690 RepID=UPI00143B2296|nr:hypothetical protein [Paenibacillus sp. HB172176]
MRRQTARAITIALLTAALVMGSTGMGHTKANAAPAEQSTDASIKAYAGQLRDKLSQAQGYESWKQADTSISALGPGTHTWLVLLKKEGASVGYMIIHAVEAGSYELGEYGIGPYPPYQSRSLRNTLLQLELSANPYRAERIYLSPLQTIWQITSNGISYYGDAFSGEALPVTAADYKAQDEQIDSDWLNSKKQGLLAVPASLSQQIKQPFFDPYFRFPWLTKPPLEIDSLEDSKLIDAITSVKSKPLFTTNAFDGKARFVWSVVGFDRFETGELYIALDADGSGTNLRYIPYGTLAALGSFYL